MQTATLSRLARHPFARRLAIVLALIGILVYVMSLGVRKVRLAAQRLTSD